MHFNEGKRMAQMKNPLMLASGALAAAGAGTGADAQSMPDGFYAGLSFGEYNGARNADAYSWSSTGRPGVFVGYDQDFGNFFLGGEVALTLGGALSVPSPDPFYPGATGENLVDFKVRFGKEFGGTKIYGFVGYSRMDASEEAYAGPGPTYTTTTMTLTGMNGGIGMSYAINSNIDIGLEYIRRDLDDSAAFYTATDNLSTVALRVGFRF